MAGSAQPVWTFEQPRGCLPLVGASILGSCALGAVAVVLGMQYGEAAWGVAMLVLVVGALPLGIWFAVGRQGVTVDVQRGTVQEWRRAVVMLESRFHSLAQFQEVTVAREKVRGVEALSWLYHVRLCGPDAQVELWAPGAYEPAREVALALSEHTGLPLTDKTLP